MNGFEQLQTLHDVDYFLLKDYYAMKNLIDKSVLDKEETNQVAIRLNALVTQRDRLGSVIGLIEGDKLFDSLRPIATELDIIRQFFDTEIRYAKRGVPKVLNLDDTRLSQYVLNQAKVLKTYHFVLNQLDCQFG